MAGFILEGRHGVYLNAKIVEKFTGKEKEGTRKDGTKYKSQVRILKVMGDGFQEPFFFSGDDAVKTFEALPSAEAAAGKRFDILAPVEVGADGKKRLGTPRLFPAGAIKLTMPEIGTVASALDESGLPGTGRRAA